jgi:hypothetical protein
MADGTLNAFGGNGKIINGQREDNELPFSRERAGELLGIDPDTLKRVTGKSGMDLTQNLDIVNNYYLDSKDALRAADMGQKKVNEDILGTLGRGIAFIGGGN